MTGPLTGAVAAPDGSRAGVVDWRRPDCLSMASSAEGSVGRADDVVAAALDAECPAEWAGMEGTAGLIAGDPVSLGWGGWRGGGVARAAVRAFAMMEGSWGTGAGTVVATVVAETAAGIGIFALVEGTFLVAANRLAMAP